MVFEPLSNSEAEHIRGFVHRGRLVIENDLISRFPDGLRQSAKQRLPGSDVLALRTQAQPTLEPRRETFICTALNPPPAHAHRLELPRPRARKKQVISRLLAIVVKGTK